MGKLIVTEFVSVDGVCEDPGGSEQWENGGWAFEYERGAEGDQFKLDELMASDALLLGRVTYEGFAEAWPSREGEFADKFNGMPKYVVSRTLQDPEWTNTTVVGGNLAEAIADIKERHAGDIAIHGSPTLVQSLVDTGLIDEYRLMVFPVLLGSGKHLFAGTAAPVGLELVETKPAGECTILIYRPGEK
jgi:dihydrofolate reductase